MTKTKNCNAMQECKPKNTQNADQCAKDSSAKSQSRREDSDSQSPARAIFKFSTDIDRRAAAREHPFCRSGFRSRFRSIDFAMMRIMRSMIMVPLLLQYSIVSSLPLSTHQASKQAQHTIHTPFSCLMTASSCTRHNLAVLKLVRDELLAF